MRLKKVGNVQKHSGKGKTPNEENRINSKEEIKNTKEELNMISPIRQIDYDELPDGVYDFSGLTELQHRKTKPNLKENEKLLKSKYKKNKNNIKQRVIDIRRQEQYKNIVEELFEAKKNNEHTFVKDFIIKDEPEEEKKETVIDSQKSNIENKEESKVAEVDVKEYVKKEDNNLKEVNEVQEVKEIQEKKDEIIVEVKKPVQEIEEKKNEAIVENVKEEKHKEEQEDYEEYDDFEDEDYYEEGLLDKILYWLKPNKKFAFLIMFFLGIITQISFLATSRANNLTGLATITLTAIFALFVVNILDIRNKLLIFIISLIAVLTPYYNSVLIIGENSLIYSSAIVLASFSLNLIFVKKNKIISFIFALVLFVVSYKIHENCIEIFLVISILKIIKDVFNKKEKISKFLLHCGMICAILIVGIII